jgi:hypothetical protein
MPILAVFPLRYTQWEVQPDFPVNKFIIENAEFIIFSFVGIGFQNFGNDKGFKHIPHNSRTFQGIRGQPFGKIAGDPGVTEINFGSFAWSVEK